MVKRREIVVDNPPNHGSIDDSTNKAPKKKAKKSKESGDDSRECSPVLVVDAEDLDSNTAKKPTSRVLAPQPIVDLFWKFSSPEKTVREAAVFELVGLLGPVQQVYLDAESGRREMVAKPLELQSDSLSIYCHPDVLYCLWRLTRGLSSSRQGSRQGFALALTGLISHVVPFLPTKILLEMIFEQNKTSADMRGAEEREMFFGQCFGVFSVLRAGDGRFGNELLTRMEDREHLIAVMLTLFNKKTFLREMCYQMIMLVVSQMNDELSLSCNHPLIVRLLQSNIFRLHQTSCESIALALFLESKFKWIQWDTILKSNYYANTSSPSHLDNFPSIAESLKNSMEFTHPRLHISWKLILRIFHAKSILPVFWKNVVDETLVVSTNNRKHLALKLFFELLVEFDEEVEEVVKAVISVPLLSLLLREMADKALPLHKCASSLFALLMQRCASNAALTMWFLKSTVGCQKEILELCTTRLHIRKNIESMFCGETVVLDEFLPWCFATFHAPVTVRDTDDDATNSCAVIRLHLLHLLAFLPKHAKGSNLHALMDFISRIALSTPATPLRPPLSPHLHVIARQKWWGMVRECVLTNDEFDICNFLLSIDALEGAEMGDAFLLHRSRGMSDSIAAQSPTPTQLDETELYETRQIYTKAVESMRSVKRFLSDDLVLLTNEDKQCVGSMSGLMALLVLRMKSSLDLVEVKECGEMLTDLMECIQRFSVSTSLHFSFLPRAFGFNPLADALMTGGDQLEPLSVLTDLLISLMGSAEAVDTSDHDVDARELSELSRCSFVSVKLVRHMVTRVFKVVAPNVDAACIGILLRVINPVEASKYALNPMNADDSDDGDDDDSDDGDLGDSDAGDDSDEGDDSNDIGKNNSKSPTDDEDEEEEVALDDEQMLSMGFDSKLSEMFKLKRKSKKKSTPSNQAAIDSRNRVLDFVEILIRLHRKRPTPQSLLNISLILKNLLQTCACFPRPTAILLSLPKVAEKSTADAEDADDADADAHSSTLDAFQREISSLATLSTPQREQYTARCLSLIKLCLSNQVIKSTNADGSSSPLHLSIDQCAMLESLATDSTRLLNVTYKVHSSVLLPPVEKSMKAVVQNLIAWICRLLCAHHSHSDCRRIMETDVNGPMLNAFVLKKSVSSVTENFFAQLAVSMKSAGEDHLLWSSVGLNMLQRLVALSELTAKSTERTAEIVNQTRYAQTRLLRALNLMMTSLTLKSSPDFVAFLCGTWRLKMNEFACVFEHESKDAGVDAIALHDADENLLSSADSKDISAASSKPLRLFLLAVKKLNNKFDLLKQKQAACVVPTPSS